jgi:glucose/arabinose dehydrogenase
LEPRQLLSTLPAGFVESVFASGLENPTAMDFAPDGRLFVTEKAGRLRVVENGTLRPAPLLTLPVSTFGERGLLGITFDPQFATNQHFYVFYSTAAEPIHNRVSRFTANGNSVVSGSELVLLDMNPLGTGGIHSGGAIHFGSDGKLYIATGDNRISTAPQSLSSLFGKVLRINADGSIPSDNPFYNTASGSNRAIWALGLRSPFTFDVQPGTGRKFLNDVGEVTWEEINELVAGANYGWPQDEGEVAGSPNRNPLFAYRHGSAGDEGCAITGGAFYNPSVSQFPAQYVGQYFFMDHCNGWLRRYDPASDTAFDFGSGLVANGIYLTTSSDGALYYLTYNEGTVQRISFPSSDEPPSITQHPTSAVVAVGQAVSLAVSATGTLPLSFQWFKNGQALAGATAATLTIASATPGDAGSYHAVVSNAAGSATSDTAVLTVSANAPPSATINSPLAGSLYTAGDVISYSGSGHDPETGALPASAMTWRVDFHHADHFHPFLAATSGASGGSFTIPTGGETAADVFYRIHLSVRDPSGLTGSTHRDVLPRTANLTLSTSPPGLGLTLDGQAVATSLTVSTVVGLVRTLGIQEPQLLGGTYYVFDSWSDGGAATHSIVVPNANTTYTANFRAVPSYQQSTSAGRLVSIEAENFVSSVERSGHAWNALSDGSASGGRAVQANPNTGQNINTSYTTLSPRIDFPVNFTATGTHYVWVRGRAGSTADDSLHAGLDDTAIATADKVHGFSIGSAWKWSRATGDGDSQGNVNPARINVASVGPHVVNLWMREDGILVDKIVLTTDAAFVPTGLGPAESPRPATPPIQAFQQDSGANGLVSIESEHFSATTVRSGHSWSAVAPSGASGSSAMQATPNNGLVVASNYAANSPRIDYPINFNRTGTHYVWVRGRAGSTADDSLHAGLNGGEVATADKMQGFNNSGWKWSRATGDGNPATINIASMGVHVLNLWMREDGMTVDKVVVTSSASYTPTGLGPAESSQMPAGGGGQAAQQALNRLSQSFAPPAAGDALAAAMNAGAGRGRRRR